MNNTYSTNRIEWIDTIKGFACISVAIGHFFGTYNSSVSATMKFILEVPLKPLISGSLMVCVFAVLSGLLTSLSTRKISLLKSIFKRYIQLMIPIFFTGVIAWVISNTCGFAPTKMREILNITSETYAQPLNIKTVLFEGLGGYWF